MAKGQQRSNREVKKPKANKLVVSSETANSLSKKIVAPSQSTKKKD
jgi:hypothetical protein